MLIIRLVQSLLCLQVINALVKMEVTLNYLSSYNFAFLAPEKRAI